MKHGILVALVVMAWARCSAAQLEEVPGGPAADPLGVAPPAALGLQIGPIEGLTSAWHRAPAAATLPVGSLVYFKQPAPAEAVVTWSGASEVARDGSASIAGLPVDGLNTVRVEVDVEFLSPSPDGLGPPARAKWTSACDVTGAIIDLRSFSAGALVASATPLDLGATPTNAELLEAYFSAASIADLQDLGHDHFATSVHRPVVVASQSEPSLLAPFVEWRVDGEVVGLGPRLSIDFQQPGWHRLEAGPPGAPSLLSFEIYSVSVAMLGSPAEWREGVPTTFVARTDPPGHEGRVTWIAAGTAGVPQPITAKGPVFTTVFAGSAGPASGSAMAWLAVKADNATLGSGPCVPQPSITQPEASAVLTGVAQIHVDQLAGCLANQDITLVTYEHSSDGGSSWNTIDQASGPELDFQNLLGVWEANWDTSGLPPGSYELRVTMQTAEGTGTSPTVAVLVNAAPVPSASATPGAGTNDVHFDGSSSMDPDGTILSWEWSFGDGGTATGPVVEHTYSNPNRRYNVILTVTDDDGAQESRYYFLSLAGPTTGGLLSFILAEICIVTSIELRGDDLPGEAAALGEDGKPGGKDWDKIGKRSDGKTLGPLDGNPENFQPPLVEKNYTGYAFEVVASVFGNPAKCKEIQLVKASLYRPGFADMAACTGAGGKWNAGTMLCEFPDRWVGSFKDLDLDGTFDIFVATPGACAAAGGTWDGATLKCSLPFAQSGAKYGPDEYKQFEPGGAYESPFDFKKHAGDKVIWYDGPSIKALTTGNLWKMDFVAILRGTDGKYAYMKYSMSAETKNGGAMGTKDVEGLRLTDAGGVGKVNVPGVP